MVLLTNPGKVVAMSAHGGSILWTYFDPQEKAVNVLIDQNGVISVISENAITYLNPSTGTQVNRENLQQSMGIKADFLIVNTQNGDIQDQVVVSIPRD